MKIKTSLIALTVAWSGLTHGYFIESDSGYVDVGEIDTYIASTSLTPSSGETQLDFASDVLDTDVSYATRNNNVELYSVYTEVEGRNGTRYVESDDLFGFELVTDPGYYIIKNGGAVAEVNTVLFENEESTGWGVLSYSYLEELGLHLGEWSDLEISHVTELVAEVTEPASILLISIGVLGLIGARRRLNQKA